MHILIKTDARSNNIPNSNNGSILLYKDSGIFVFTVKVMSYAPQTSEHPIQSPDHVIPSEHTEIVEMLGYTTYVGLLMDIEDECLWTEAQILSLFLSLSVMEVHCREKKVCHLLDYCCTIFFKSNTVERPIITFMGAYTLQLLVHIWVRMTGDLVGGNVAFKTWVKSKETHLVFLKLSPEHNPCHDLF